MSEKYNTDRLITNDLYLTAFLLSSGCHLARLEKNARRRVSFVITGPQAQKLRQEYKGGVVRLNVRSFKENLLTIRKKMDTKQRSVPPCPFPTPLSRA